MSQAVGTYAQAAYDESKQSSEQYAGKEEYGTGHCAVPCECPRLDAVLLQTMLALPTVQVERGLERELAVLSTMMTLPVNLPARACPKVKYPEPAFSVPTLTLGVPLLPGLSWSRPVMTGVAPKARGGHAAALVGNLLIVVGGHYYGGDSASPRRALVGFRGFTRRPRSADTFVYLDDVWAIDVDTMTWHNPACAGGGPSARYGHTASVIEYKYALWLSLPLVAQALSLPCPRLAYSLRLYVFGGRGPKGALYNDLWCLDVERWTWERMSSTTAAPTGRFGHSQLTIGSKIVYFGGWDGSHAFNDLWVYDTEAFSWLKPRVGGTPPRARFNHISELSPDGRIIVFGGCVTQRRVVSMTHPARCLRVACDTQCGFERQGPP